MAVNALCRYREQETSDTRSIISAEAAKTSDPKMVSWFRISTTLWQRFTILLSILFSKRASLIRNRLLLRFISNSCVLYHLSSPLQKFAIPYRSTHVFARYSISAGPRYTAQGAFQTTLSLYRYPARVKVRCCSSSPKSMPTSGQQEGLDIQIKKSQKARERWHKCLAYVRRLTRYRLGRSLQTPYNRIPTLPPSPTIPPIWDNRSITDRQTLLRK